MLSSLSQKCTQGVASFGQWLMRGRREAIMVAILTALLPFLSGLSLIVVSLVTLRKGMKEGLAVLSCALVPAYISVYWTTDGSVVMALQNVVAYFVLWGMAGLLRKTASWQYVLEVLMGLAVGFVIIFHWYVPDLNDIYFRYLMQIYQSGLSDVTDTANAAVNMAQVQDYVQTLVQYLFGFQTMLYVLQNVFYLLMARGIQAILYNPMGLSNDLRTIRLSWFSWGLAAVLLLLNLQWSLAWGRDCVPLFGTLFFLAGLSLVHYGMKVKAKYKGSAALFYVLLFLLAPFSVLFVILLALIDTACDIRKRFFVKS